MGGVTRRGVYIDLAKSPYEFKTPYGALFKFSSQKKMEIYTRDIAAEVKRLEKLLERHNLQGFIYDETIEDLTKGVYEAFYKAVER